MTTQNDTHPTRSRRSNAAQSYPPGEYMLVEPSMLQCLTAEGWHLVQAFVEKRFMSLAPYQNPGVICETCRNPAEEVREPFRRTFYRSEDVKLVKTVRFLVRRGHDEAKAKLNETIDGLRSDLADSLDRLADDEKLLREGAEKIGELEHKLEELENGRQYDAGDLRALRTKCNKLEELLGRARKEVGMARWREIFNEQEREEDIPF